MGAMVGDNSFRLEETPVQKVPKVKLMVMLIINYSVD